jgi:hypothetical protein
VEKHAAIDALEELLPTASRPAAGWMRDLATSGGAGGELVNKAVRPTEREAAPLAFAESDLQADAPGGAVPLVVSDQGQGVQQPRHATAGAALPVNSVTGAAGWSPRAPRSPKSC